MKRFFLFLCLLFLLSACSPNLGSPAASQDGVEVYIPEATIGRKGSTAAIFLTIKNTTANPDFLLGVFCDVSEVIEFHQTKMDHDMMKMDPVEVLEVPANGTLLELKRGSYHIMLINLLQDLNENDVVKIKLRFESAGDIALDVPVKGP